MCTTCTPPPRRQQNSSWFAAFHMSPTENELDTRDCHVPCERAVRLLPLKLNKYQQNPLSRCRGTESAAPDLKKNNILKYEVG